LSNIVNGKDAIAYHGTNKDFNSFNIETVRKWRADMFYGVGIGLTSDKYVAEKYANAGSNDELSLEILNVAKSVNKQLYDFMYSLYYKGNITWNLPKFRTMIDDWKFKIDPNDVASIVNLIPGSKSYEDYNADNINANTNPFVNIFANSSSALSDYVIQDIKDLGLGNYEPQVYTVLIKGTDSVLLSKKPAQIKKSNHDIIIAYNVPDLVDDVPEIIVKNTSLLKIIKKEPA
jgi:hypothetical protein